MKRRTFLASAAMWAAMPAVALAATGENGPVSSVVSDEPVKLSVCVDKPVAQVAEPIQLVLEVEAPRGTRVEMPRLSGELGAFDVRADERTKDIPVADHPETRRWVLESTLDTTKTGDLLIPPLDVHYATGDATTFKTLRSKPVQVRITSVLENRADPTKFRDIKDTVDLAVPKVRSYAWLGWSAAGVGAVAALALFVVAVARRRCGPSPAEWALAEIDGLRQLHVENETDAEAIYNEVVDIVREFFGLEFNVPTLSRTTHEFLAQAAREVGLSETARNRLASLASIADEIKFARLGVGEEQVRQAFDEASSLIGECEAHSQALQQEAA